MNEEIREGIAERIIANSLWKLKDLSPENREHYLGKADDVMSYLHSQGVVIKVDRELPDPWEMPLDSAEAGYGWLVEEMGKAGYAAVGPLV